MDNKLRDKVVIYIHFLLRIVHEHLTTPSAELHSIFFCYRHYINPNTIKSQTSKTKYSMLSSTSRIGEEWTSA